MTGEPLRVLVIGDPYFSASDFGRAMGTLADIAELSYLQIDTTEVAPPSTESERSLREYAGVPSEIAAAATGFDVLVVHGAAVSAQAFEATDLRLVCCARGGPVNVDVAAATAAGVPVCNTPGKNAEAVAELTIAFALMLIRGVGPSTRELAAGRGPSASVFDGRRFFGLEAASLTLGLVGFGHVGRHVARRARQLGFRVLAHDPYAGADELDDVPLVALDELLERSDIVSLHARATADNRQMMDATQFARMRSGSYFINTAREQLVDEVALLAALESGALLGAALDVIERLPDGSRNALLDQPSVVVTPHIGGATHETLARGAAMAVLAIRAFAAGEDPPFVVNPAALQRETIPLPSAQGHA